MMDQDKKDKLLDLVKQAHTEEIQNIKRSRENIQRALAGEPLQPYQNKAIRQLAKEIAQM